jgi:peptide/nickel transport system permease protein
MVWLIRGLLMSSQSFKPKSFWRIVLEQFLEHRMAVVGVAMISGLFLMALFAPVISSALGIHPDHQNVFHRFEGMGTRLPYSSVAKERALDQFLLRHDLTELQEYVYRVKLYPDVPFEDVLYELVERHHPADLVETLASFPENLGKTQEFQRFAQSLSTYHLLGTDELGRDVFIRLIYGTRVSLTVGLMVAFAAALIGLFIGSLAGYYGGFLDTLLMRLTDSLLSLPLLVVLIVVSAIDLTKVFDGTPLSFIVGSKNESMIKMILILCLFSWMQVARLIRGSILSLKEQEFVLAAKTLGARDPWIIIQHMVPNVIAPLLVAVTLGIGNSILFEAALSFLGLGIQPPTPSWGNMLNNAQEMLQHAPMLAILPGVLILITVMSFNYIGDGLQDAIDPKAIRR